MGIVICTNSGLDNGVVKKNFERDVTIEQLHKRNMTIYKLHKFNFQVAKHHICGICYGSEIPVFLVAESFFTETLLTSIHCNDSFSQSQLHFHFFPVIIYYIFQCTC